MQPSTPSLLKFLGLNTQGDLGPWTFYTSKDKGLVWYPKAPPLTPASYLQSVQRNKWRLCARLWASYTQDQRDAWLQAALRARLWIGGYNLFVYVVTKPDTSVLPAIERASDIDLPDIPNAS